MKIMINVITPKNQARKCIESQKDALVGITKRKKIIEQKVTAHNKFYWIMQVQDQKEYEGIMRKCSLGETLIKKFYSALFKLIRRANSLAAKSSKGISYMKRWIKKRLDKVSQNNEAMKQQIDNMTDEDFIDWLKITDEEPMKKMLKGELITIKVLTEPPESNHT